MTRAEYLVGKRVRIIATSNPFAKSVVGKVGLVTGLEPMGASMVKVALEGHTPGDDYAAQTYNLELVR